MYRTQGLSTIAAENGSSLTMDAVIYSTVFWDWIFEDKNVLWA
jgi:hypothetical protein